MSKIATKAIESRWCQERYKAAAYNGRLSSREGAAEETGIERTRMARIELGTLTPYPEEALLMAVMPRKAVPPVCAPTIFPHRNCTIMCTR